jgi:ABC-type nickel/cobalt efflux system permease component RcnA
MLIDNVTDTVGAFFRGVFYVLLIAAGIAISVIPIYVMVHFAWKYW